MKDAKEKAVRIVNNRPVAFFALFFVAGIFLGAVLYGHGAALIAAAALLAVSGVVLIILKKKIFFVFVAVLLGVAAFFISFSLTQVEEKTVTTVMTGRIKEREGRSGGYLYSYILTDTESYGQSLGRNALLYTNEELETGDLIILYGKVEAFNYKPFDSYSMSFLNGRINYIIKADSAAVYGKSGLNFTERLYKAIKGSYLKYMGKEGGTALSLVFGDTAYLDKDVREGIRDSGLYHIFSVSGLHVAFLAAFAFYIFRLFKINKKLSLILIAALLIFYGMLTGFPASLIRASVMLAVMLFGQLTYRRFDPLSALSLSVIIILIANPLSLFELGFQMSVTAMLGIFCFYRPLKRFFHRGTGKISAFLSSSLAMSMSTNSLLIAVTVNTFQAAGIYFCLGNLLVIPLIGLIYSLLMLFTVVTLVIPPTGVLMVLTKYMLYAVTETASFIASLPYATVEFGRGLGIFSFIFAAALIFMSKFIMIDRTKKFYILSGVTAASVVLMFLL